MLSGVGRTIFRAASICMCSTICRTTKTNQAFLKASSQRAYCSAGFLYLAALVARKQPNTQTLTQLAPERTQTDRRKTGNRCNIRDWPVVNRRTIRSNTHYIECGEMLPERAIGVPGSADLLVTSASATSALASFFGLAVRSVQSNTKSYW